MTTENLSWKTWEYNFPPFFTLQPVASTRKKQIIAWGTILQNYCMTKKLTEIDLTCEVFENKQINRKLSNNDIQEIFLQLSQMEIVKFSASANESKDKVIVLYKSLSSWADSLFTAAKNLNWTVNSVYDIINGEDTESYDFHGQSEELVLGSLVRVSQSGHPKISS